MDRIAEQIALIRKDLPAHVTLVRVSKFQPAEAIQAAYTAGERDFGESRVQELLDKHRNLPQDIRWHFIGHLQTNKVKYIAPYISMVDAVDSLRLLREIQKQAARHDRVIDVLLELHIAEEETKYGFSLDECREMLEEGEWRQMSNVRICGLMMMASYVEDTEQIRREMTLAADFFDEVKQQFFADVPYFKERSWGMSHDYHIACQCRSTMVRVGTAIFGSR